MKLWTLTMIASVALVLGCGGGQTDEDPISLETEGVAPPQAPITEDTVTAPATQPQAEEPAPPPAQREPSRQRPEPRPVQRQTRAPVQRVDTPFRTSDTGTVSPGMSETQVTDLWGAPAARREDGAFVYLFFRNGCEWSCGMYDVVLLENNQVVDALLRFSGHRYAGTSSSPRGAVPAYTPPDTTRRGPPDDNAEAEP